MRWGLRRVLGAALCLSPLGLALASLFCALAAPRPETALGLAPAALGLAITGLNFHLSFIRPAWRRRQGKPEHHVSGLPIVSHLFMLGALSMGFGALYTSLATVATAALDTGGTLWLLVWTWKDESFWNG